MTKAKSKRTTSPPAKTRGTFNAAHKTWLKTHSRWRAIEATGALPDKTIDRMVDTRGAARRAATKRLAAIRSQDVRQLAAKTAALWDMATCDYPTENHAIRFGDFGEEEFGLLKSIHRDAARLAKGGA